MQGLISDADFLGGFRRILDLLNSEEWRPYWNDLDLSVFDFDTLGLEHHAKDRTVWDRCQELGLILITGNRNHDGPDSLEATIQAAGEDSLPVFTVADKERVREDGVYARAVTIDLLDYLFEWQKSPEAMLGIGRIYLPKKPV